MKPHGIQVASAWRVRTTFGGYRQIIKLELLYNPPKWDAPLNVFDGFPRQQEGHVTLSDAPGLGLELNETEIAAHPALPRVNARGGTVKGM